MAGFRDLPNEILQAIVQHISGVRSKASFGVTCRHHWEISKSEVYRSVTISTGDAKQVAAVFKVASSHVPLIKELTVILEPAKFTTRGRNSMGMGMFDGISDGRFKKDNQLWKSTVAPILSAFQSGSTGLAGNLQALSITLPDYGQDLFGQERCDVHSMTCKRMDLLLTAAAANSDPTITSLTIHNLPNYRSPVLKSARLRGLLNRLEYFELVLFGEREELATTNGDDDFPEFVASLSNNIFPHLSSVKRVKFGATWQCIVGHTQDEERAAPLHLGRGTMPKLEHLELDTTVIDHPFIEFLEHRPRNSQPLSLTLTNTTAYDHGWLIYKDPSLRTLEWHEVFDKMSQLMDNQNFPGIKSFAATFMDVTPYYWDEEGVEPKTIQEHEALKKLRDICDPNRPMFAYVGIASEFGYLHGGVDTTKKAYFAGKDQAAYDKFVAKVAKFSDEHTKKRTHGQS